MRVVRHRPAQQISAAISPQYDRYGDVHLSAVLQDASSQAANTQEPSLLWHLQGNLLSLRLADGGNALTGAVVALTIGKGKEKGAANGNF